MTRCSALLAALVVASAPGGQAAAETIDPGETGSRHAWSENAGWVNAEPAGDGGPGLRITDEGVTGWMSLENAGWVSASCYTTGSCAEVDYGLTVSPAGEIGGFAWSENAGWIVFSCATTASCGTVSYGVTVNLVNGELAGHAWSENLGWITVSCETTSSCGVVDYRTTTTVPIPDELFSDNLETSTTARWSQTVP